MLASFDSLDLDTGRSRGPGRHYTSIVGEWCGRQGGRLRRLCRDNAPVRACAWNMIRSTVHTSIFGAQPFVGIADDMFHLTWHGARTRTAIKCGVSVVALCRCFQPRSAKSHGPHDAGVRGSELLSACCISYCGNMACGVFLFA